MSTTLPPVAPTMPDIQLQLSIDELNLILEGVGNLPFAKVYTLVAKIQAQAAEQIKAAQAEQARPAPAGGTPAAAPAG